MKIDSRRRYQEEGAASARALRQEHARVVEAVTVSEEESWRS